MISKFRVAWLLNYISIASFSATIITPALPLMQVQYKLSNAQVEWLISIFLLGYVFGQLIYAPLANRWGRLLALRLGLVINLVGVLLALLGIFENSFITILWGRFITALGAAGGLACTYMLINEWLPEKQRTVAIAYSILAFTIGIGAAVTIGGLVSDNWSWKCCFVLLLIHGVIMLAGTKLFSETLVEPQGIHVSVILNNYRKALASRQLIVFSLLLGFCSAMGYCFSASGPQIAHHILGISASTYGYWNLLNMIAMFMGGLWSRRLLQQFSVMPIIGLGLFGSAAGIVSLLLMLSNHSSSPLWFFASTMNFYLFGGLLFAGGSMVASTAIADKASASSMMSFLNMLSATIAVISLGYMSVNPLLAFIETLATMWVLVTVLLILECTRKQGARPIPVTEM
ncbi:MFS transporter [Legionella jordanis]|uniref:Major facilitator superfamily (MFS) transporter n=1 Tax=Legionella jordanis TaxID=456 RepID=A0A0W0VFX4_9GAMM|nr:MFS transporter [Legionella jordanis]KTD18939.1 major facilitator superfamily (MFS) transporter [Legionella jordanis]RMX05497.1 MFS transporter [Legionella jordanis]RMX19182.1 MFS transporter [Legionella jordanis]VEH13039.1 major facilitator superfamily (MFS) transporter [Legionella jordanis]